MTGTGHEPGNEESIVETLNRQLRRAGTYPFYRRLWGGEPPRLTSLADLARLPLVARGALAADAVEHDPPRGSFYRADVVRINLTPSPSGLRPIYHTQADVALARRVNAALFAAAGVRAGDVAITTMSYSLFPAGLMIHEAFEEVGAKVIPVGAGDSERTADLVRRWQVNVLYANPSFAVRLAEQGLRSVRVLIAGGEPFSAIPGYKDGVRAALGGQAVLVESYGLADCTPVARECRYERGMHVADEFVYVEIVDPETGRRSGPGETGEIVVTHLHKEAMPLVRYRTGDLAAVVSERCACGRSQTIAGGIRGRVDEMRKVKGVKLYPQQVRDLLDRIEGVQGCAYRLVVRRTREGADHLSLRLALPSLAEATVQSIREAFRREFVITPNEVTATMTMSPGPLLVDERESGVPAPD